MQLLAFSTSNFFSNASLALATATISSVGAAVGNGVGGIYIVGAKDGGGVGAIYNVGPGDGYGVGNVDGNCVNFFQNPGGTLGCE